MVPKHKVTLFGNYKVSPSENNQLAKLLATSSHEFMDENYAENYLPV